MARRLALSALLIAFTIGGVPAATYADGDERDGHGKSEHSDDDRDHEAREYVRKGVERGELKSLSDVLRTVEPKLPGTVVGIEIERKNETWVYEFRTTDRGGRLFDVYVDAATARILEIKEK